MFLLSFAVAIPAALLFLTCIGIPVLVYLGIGWSLVLQAIMLEGRATFDSLRRSWHLVEGHRWRLLVIFILLILIQSVLLSIPSLLIGLVSFGATLLSGGNAVVQLVMQVVETAFNTAAQVVFTPIALITATLLFYDLMVRKEAFDLQQRLPQAEIVVPPQYPPYGQQPPYPQQPPQYPPYGQPQYPQQPPQTPGYPPYPPPPPPTPGPPQQ